MKLQLDAPNVGALEKKYLNDAIDRGFVSTFGPLVPEFETAFAEFLGVKKAVSVQSGTAAIYMALYELGIGEGDEIIVPALTFVATVNPVRYVGARPVFADVDRDTWNMLPQEIERLVTRRTKAIIPVHFYGNPCDMISIRRIAEKHKLHVIEDAAESLGAKYKGRHTGTFGDFGCFSFNGNKVVTTGGGGMVIGKDSKKIQHIKFLVNQGRDESKGFYHPEIGFNYRMTNIEAALGLAQMKRLNEFLMKKRRFCRIYQEELAAIDGIRFQKEHDGAESSRWFTCVTFERDINIPRLQKTLAGEAIPTRRVFMPVTEFPPYSKDKRASYRNSYDIYARGLCLPGSTLNTEKDILFACKKIKRFVKG